ncbi:MAG: hypothetical protein VXY26_03615 [Bacteroidota bacterium]|nr:hypothetical protein [Bacteroidota bacterium]
MKVLFILTLIPFLGLAQSFDNSYTFSDPIIVSNNPELGLTRPRIIVVENGSPVIMWTSVNNNKIYVSRYVDNEFIEPESILPENFTFFGAPNYGPEIDNNGNTIAIVFSNSANETNNLYFIYSLDAGVTFSNPIKIIEEDAFIEGAGVHINSNNIPIVTYENLQSNGIANQLVGFGQFIDNSPGVVFDDFIVANASTEGIPCECCLGNLTTNDEHLVFSYRNNINNVRNMFACTYNDFTNSFDEGFSIDNYNQSLTVCPTEGPKSLLINNYLITSFKSYGYSPSRISTTIYDLDNDLLMSESEVDWDQGYGTQSLPEIAGNESVIAVVWKEFRYYNFDVFISISNSPSNNSEINFSTSSSVSSTIPNSQNANDFTSVDISEYNGEFHIVYLDFNDSVIYYRTYFEDEINDILENRKEKDLINKTDILGRKINNHGIQLEFYNDGSVEKKYIIGD